MMPVESAVRSCLLRSRSSAAPGSSTRSISCLRMPARSSSASGSWRIRPAAEPALLDANDLDGTLAVKPHQEAAHRPTFDLQDRADTRHAVVVPYALGEDPL